MKATVLTSAQRKFQEFTAHPFPRIESHRTGWYLTRRDFCGALFAAAAAPRRSSAPVLARRGEGQSPCFAIENVTVLSMVPGAPPMANMTVVIAGGQIASIEAADGYVSPEGCLALDGRGGWLLPSLTDMHVHFLSEPIPELNFGPEELLTPYLANGVLQILDMAATRTTNAIRAQVAAGAIAGPAIASAAMIDGVPAIRPGARESSEPGQASAVVAEIATAGFDFVKVYSRLEPDVFAAVLAAGEELGIRVIGHLPGSRKVPVAQVLQPGFAMIAHAEELAWAAVEKSDAEIAAYVDLLQANGTALTSTLYLVEQILAQTRTPAVVAETEGLAYVHPAELTFWFEENAYIPRRSAERIGILEGVADFSARLVKTLVEAGVPVLAGTDASFVPGLAPGFALHEELASLVLAGLSPRQALGAATLGPARWLGTSDDRGTVEVGKRADLLLLEANPLADIRNTRAIAAVVHNGELLERPDLDARLRALDDLYAEYRPWFSPLAVEALARQDAGTSG